MKNNKLFSLPRQPLLLLLCFVILAVALSNAAHAQDWRFEPILRAGLVVDDNPRLSPRTDEEIDLTGYLLDARADIFYSSSDITSFSFQPRALLRNYPDNPEFESNDFFLRSTFRHRARSSTFGFRVNYDQQSVRTAERTDTDIDIEDPDEIPEDDTGRVGLDGNRSRWRISPYWNYRFSNVSSIDVSIDYFDTRYDEVFALALIDYTDARISLGYRRAFSDITTGIVKVTGRRFEPDRILNDNTGYGFLAGFEREVSAKTHLLALIGVENTEQALGQTDAEVIGNITFTRKLETISMFARFDRAVTASGSGTVELRNTLSMNFYRRLHERISAGLGIRAYDARRVGSAASIGDRDFVQLQTMFRWYLSKAFVVEADYRYTILDRSSATGERANANQVGLWFVYQPNTTPRLQL